MVDLSKHLARAQRAVKSRNFDLAIQVCLECQEVDPTNMDNYAVLLDAARRRAQEGGKKNLMGQIGFFASKLSKDANKRLTAAVKSLGSGPDDKALAACGDAARVAYDGNKDPKMAAVAVMFYEEVRKSGLFNDKVLWNIAHVYHGLYMHDKDGEKLEKAINAMADLKKTAPNHPDAGRTLQNWEALRSMTKRVSASDGSDFTSQVASSSEARRNELMGRVVRTRADADEVLAFIDADLKKNPRDKQMWVKRGDVLRRIRQFVEARAAYVQASEVDPHDFNIQIAIGDCDIALKEEEIEAAQEAGQDVSAARQALRELQITEYRKRSERQPTEAKHRYLLGINLYQSGDIDGAAAELQKSVGDARYKRSSHKALGQCFVKKGLADLAIDQFSSFLKLTDDDHEQEAKDVLYKRARLLEQADRAEEAKADYRHLVEIDLGYKDAADRLGALS